MTQTDAQYMRCAACGTVNRVPLEKLAQGLAPVCGQCKSSLSVGKPVTVTDATFHEEVEQSALPVLVDMWAPWCGPCRMIAPFVDQLALEMAGRLRVTKLNVDENPNVAMRFDIQSIPALLVFKDGREVDRIVGAVPKAEIARRLKPWVE
jgi:thioredoxin 2